MIPSWARKRPKSTIERADNNAIRPRNSETKRLRSLDGLRGIAAVAVVIYHYLYVAPETWGALAEPLAPARFGAQGVQLFFVISGFVITMSLRRGTIRDFIASRISRLFPLYWFAVLLTAAALTIFGLPGRYISAGQVAINLTMIQSYFGVEHIDGVYWTLAIELAFYVQACALWHTGLLNPRLRAATLYVWLIVAVAAALVTPGEPLEAATPLWARDLSQAFVYLPFFILGIACLLVYEGVRNLSVLLLFPAATLASLYIDSLKHSGSFGILYALVLLVVLLWRPLGTASKVAAFFGRISYALYLLHQVLGEILLHALHRAGVPYLLGVSVTIIFAVILAWLATRFIDERLRSSIRRVLARPRSTDPDPSSTADL